MKLELTQEQLVIIWDEIIKLEEDVSFMYIDPDADKWEIVFLNQEIQNLKHIVENEYIEI